MALLNKQPLIFIVLMIVLSSCANNGKEPSTDDNGKDRKVILTHWVDNIIIPSYANFRTKFDLMVSKGNTFTSTPDQNTLSDFRNAWVDAYIEWQKVELFEFGPADRSTLRNFFNIYPTNIAGIEANINNPSVNLNVPAAYATQGFPALDYLLNGVGIDDAAIIAYYSTDADATKRLAYINTLLTQMNLLISNVISEWSGSYRDTFISNTGLDIGSSTGSVVNAFVLNYERYIRAGKIGIPSGTGLASSGTPHPEKVEAYFKRDISNQLAKAAHDASAAFFNGKSVNEQQDGPSFMSYLDGLGSKDATSGALLSTLINDQFTAISNELNMLSPNLYEQVQTDNQKMVDTYAAMQKLVRLLKVDMSSAMSITITYTDNDGD
jgi:predicted lipoprotein